MSRIRVTAMASAIVAGAAEFIYIPEGKNRITPGTHPDGVEVNVPPERGAAIAAALQSDLDGRLSQNVLPWFDFEHTRKYPASGHPKSFRYEPGKGIMCSADWSRSGRLALRGRDVNYFSPDFYIDAEGIPCGLPDRGPVGGLVTEPAFRNLPSIAASDAAADPTDPPPSSTMKLILASLGIDPAAAEAESAGVRAIESLKSKLAASADSLATITTERDTLKTENAGLKEKVTASETAAKEAATKRAGDLVSAAVADGRLAVKDEKKITDFKERIAAGDTFAEGILADLPKQGEGLDRPLISASDGDPKKGKEKKEDELSPMERLSASIADPNAK